VFLNLQHTYNRSNMQRILKRFNVEFNFNRFNLQRTYKRFSIAIGFLMLLMLLTANTIITRHLLDVQTNDQARVSHTQQILTQVGQIQSLMAYAEMGQRAYITTGDTNYLNPYDLAVTQLEPNLQQLEQLTADNPQEQGKLANLRSLVQIRMDMLSTAIVLFQAGYQDQAKEMVVSERGRLLMVKINNSMNDMTRKQSSLKGSRSITYQSSVGRTIASIYFASSIVALGIVYLAYYILQSINTRDRRARARLAREKLFRLTLTSLGDAVIATDNRGLVTFLNPKAERLMGLQFLQAKGRPVENVLPLFDEATLEPVENSVTKVMRDGEPRNLKTDILLKRSDGSLIPIKYTATLIRDRRDKLLGAVLVFRDATYERQTKDLLGYTDRLVVSTMLLAAASRQIDAPLVAASDLIYFAKLNADVAVDTSNLLTLAEGHLGRASHISREVLGFYRESAPAEQIDLSVLVDAVLQSFSNKFHKKNIALERDFHNCPSIRGLYGELNQAIANLVSNAVDAVPFGGKIRAQLSCHDDTDREAVLISIRDDGPGISATNRDRLFEPFFTTKEGSGYGLGLWTTKGIVERHGGRIQVNYEGGDASTSTTFSVILPINTSCGPFSLNKVGVALHS
jgi:PAS domain S-box-containing protein